MNNELKRCPFCNGKAKLENYSQWMMQFSQVVCKKCGTKGGAISASVDKASDDEAIAAWNRRTNTKEVIS